MTRSSTPSYRPATSSIPGSRASSCANTWPKGSPWADRYRRGLPGGNRACAARIAAMSGSGFITIPGPPPYGRSSTVRCTSLVCARGSSVPTPSSPRAVARPTTPNSSVPAIMRGNSVTTSIFMEPLFQLRRPVHQNLARRNIDPLQVGRCGGHPVLAPTLLPRHHHHARRSIHKVADGAELRAFEVANPQTHEVGTVVLALRERRERRTLDLDHRAVERRSLAAVIHPLQVRHQPRGMPTPLRHLPRETLTAREPQGPLPVSEQPLRRIGMRLDVKPPLDPEGCPDTPELDPVHG